MKRFAVLAVSLAAVAGLVGCGGGGGDDVVGSPSGPSAEGYYAGTLRVTAFPATAGNPALPNTSNAFQMLVLESGEFWTFYGTPSGASLQVEGFAQGTGTSNGALFTAGGVRYFPAPPALATNAVASASYNASARSISGTITDASTTATFNSVPLVAPAYSYTAAASLASVAGVWTVDGSGGEQYTLTVAGDGTFAAVPAPAPGCSFTGNFVPRASGKNVFNVSVTNGGAPCSAPALVSTGVAFVSPAGAGFQLTFATVGDNRNLGAVISGVR
ncbi:MAG: hypothetical protein DCF26_10075 [Burkholderiales bacterium]|nr:MAG: hypothetical protein DCF26_10075 [Burkholderiales bacterium]